MKVSPQIQAVTVAKSRAQNTSQTSAKSQQPNIKAAILSVPSNSTTKVSRAGIPARGEIDLSQELLEKGYREVSNSMRPGKARGAAIATAKDFHRNIPEIGLLNSNVGAKKGAAAVSLELSSIRRDTITMMNSMPAEINVQIADEIRSLISKNQWPTDQDRINQRIKEISDKIRQNNA